MVPPVWGGPPAEIITTSDLLYASLLMSLLAAFVAMLGKQWLNRYLRHTGGSMVERCGDRQLKFNGLEKWPFRIFIESLPVMLQVALLLLACALSRYMWSINTSVASVIISFTVLGMVFYFGIVAAGTSSYECPFQTPASEALRYLGAGISTWSPLTILPVFGIVLASMTLPTANLLIYATWMDVREGLVSVFHRALTTMRSPLSWEISVSRIVSGIHSTPTRVGHQTIILLLRVDRAFGNAKHRLVQGLRRFRYPVVLPVATNDVRHQPRGRRTGPGLRIPVRNLEILRKQNVDNARCVCWVLRNITDPEAIDSAIRLASAIRWFGGDIDVDPPFELIVSAFEACFDSTKRLYPGMRDRVYFAARAILQINMRARTQSPGRASEYPIPVVSSSSSQITDPEICNILHIFEHNSGPSRPILDFANTHTHLLWMSNLFAELAHVNPNPTLVSYEPYLNAATSNHQAVVANILLVWCTLLGGHINEETFWAAEKSCVNA